MTDPMLTLAITTALLDEGTVSHPAEQFAALLERGLTSSPTVTVSPCFSQRVGVKLFATIPQRGP
mgnify:CR=1 FL=1